jgi:Family of unknown function (DUF6174)
MRCFSVNRMNMPRHRWIWLAFALPVAACMAGLWLTPLSLLPRHALAKSRWDAQGIRHYRLTAQLVQGGDTRGPWSVEIRDGQVVAGFDTASGAQLDRTQLRIAQRVLPISTIFSTIRDEINTPPLTSTFAVLTRIARLGPPLREHLNHCAARLPTIAYEPAYGYPRSVTVYGSPCVLWDNWAVQITDLTPIP